MFSERRAWSPQGMFLGPMIRMHRSSLRAKSAMGNAPASRCIFDQRVDLGLAQHPVAHQRLGNAADRWPVLPDQ